MASPLPIIDGLRRAFHDPALVLAEIAWRWTFGLAALALTVAGFLAYLSTLTVSTPELLALHSRLPWLVADAIGHILYGSGPRLARIAAILVPAIFLLWIVAATFGRAATLKALLRREDHFPLAPQFGLNTLRASVTLASLIGYLGALMLAARAAGGDDARPGIFLLVFALLVAAITIVRSRVNWFLYLAAIFAARDGDETFAAIPKAVGLVRRNVGAFLGTGAVFGTIHAVLFAFFAITWLLALSLAGKLPRMPTAIVLVSITLAYFALYDFFSISRLAMYVALDEHDRTPPAAPVVVNQVPMPPGPGPPLLPEPIPEPEGNTS